VLKINLRNILELETNTKRVLGGKKIKNSILCFKIPNSVAMPNIIKNNASLIEEIFE
jgi:hypothetical protein